MQNKFNALQLKIATNVVLGFLILSIGAVCVAPLDKSVSANVERTELYRCAEDGRGVSLLFNVYWGTDEVYQILQTLEKHNDKATFFIGGCWADDNVECLKAIYEKGHEIGNHGYFHKDHKTLSFEKNVSEISSCNQFLRLAIGQTPKLFAPPSGSYGDAMLDACKKLGMKTILWSKDTIDWRDKDCALIYKRATQNVKAGDFILLHPMQETAAALDDILKYYENNGLETYTVSENLSQRTEEKS